MQHRGVAADAKPGAFAATNVGLNHFKVCPLLAVDVLRGLCPLTLRGIGIEKTILPVL